MTTPCKSKVLDSSRFVGCYDSQCILTFTASLSVEPGNELGCKPNSGHVVMYPSLVGTLVLFAMRLLWEYTHLKILETCPSASHAVA